MNDGMRFASEKKNKQPLSHKDLMCVKETEIRHISDLRQFCALPVACTHYQGAKTAIVDIGTGHMY